MYCEEFNGFTGYGETERQAQIAVAYAASFLDLNHPTKIQYFDELPINWLIDPEGQMKALSDK